MITNAANEFAAAILKKSDDYGNMAKFYATEYARTDNKQSQQNYKNNLELSEIFRKLHAEACQAMHAIEREMRESATRDIARNK